MTWKWPGIRLSLRTLMVFTLVLGVGLGIFVAKRDREVRRARLEAQVFRQADVTERIYRDIERRARSEAETYGRLNKLQYGVGGGGTSESSGMRWSRDTNLVFHVGEESRVLIGLKLRGGTDGRELLPIVIQGGGGSHDARLIERLAEAYRVEGWAYRVEPGPPRTGASK